MCRIARELNRRGIRFRPGAKWRSSAVYAILTQQKYVGTYEFGRTSSRLYTPLIKLPKSDWILARRAFEPLIDYPTFAQAQQIVYQRTINKSNEELLVGLKGLLGRCGTLSGTLITAESNIPSPTTYRKRFGSLRKAYGLIRYVRSEDFGATELRRRTQALRDEVIDKLQYFFPSACRSSAEAGNGVANCGYKRESWSRSSLWGAYTLSWKLLGGFLGRCRVRATTLRCWLAMTVKTGL